MSYYREKTKQDLEKEREAHPVWRAIGFIFMIFVPILSFAISDILIRQMQRNNAGFVIPAQLSGGVEILPGYLVHNFWAVVIMAGLVSMLVFGFMSFITAMIHWASPHPKRSQFDVPGQAYEPKRKFRQRR